MSFYQSMAKHLPRYIGKPALFKYGFNFSPMYRRTTARIESVSPDLLEVRIKLPISYKNKNYVGSIFGGSMFAAVDPIPMVQLLNLIGDDYVAWDKSANIRFRRPATEAIYAKSVFTEVELDAIRSQVAEQNEIEIIKRTPLTDRQNDTVFCEVEKTIYVADKSFYKAKQRRRRSQRDA